MTWLKKILDDGLILEFWKSDGEYHCLVTAGAESCAREGRTPEEAAIAAADTVLPGAPILQALKGVAAPRKRAPASTPGQLEQAATRVASGASFAEVARDMGLTASALYGRLKKAGLTSSGTAERQPATGGDDPAAT